MFELTEADHTIMLENAVTPERRPAPARRILMLRISIAIAATTLIVNASQACSLCSKNNPLAAQQRSQCQSKIVAKNLSGAANKGEWKKCMNDPDGYK
jgi:hypothetical protein